MLASVAHERRSLSWTALREAFGRADWLANGVLFGLYHLGQPWSIPGAMLGGWGAAYTTRRPRCAWRGIIAHSTQSLLLVPLTLVVVLS